MLWPTEPPARIKVINFDAVQFICVSFFVLAYAFGLVKKPWCTPRWRRFTACYFFLFSLFSNQRASVTSVFLNYWDFLVAKHMVYPRECLACPWEDRASCCNRGRCVIGVSQVSLGVSGVHVSCACADLLTGGSAATGGGGKAFSCNCESSTFLVLLLAASCPLGFRVLLGTNSISWTDWLSVFMRCPICHLASIRMAEIKQNKTRSAGENVEKLEPLCTVDRIVEWSHHYGKQCGSSSKT